MPKIGYQKRDFTNKPVRQQPKHSSGPFIVDGQQIRGAKWKSLCTIHDADDREWICDLMNKAHTVESNIAANNAAFSKPMKVPT